MVKPRGNQDKERRVLQYGLVVMHEAGTKFKVSIKIGVEIDNTRGLAIS